MRYLLLFLVGLLQLPAAAAKAEDESPPLPTDDAQAVALNHACWVGDLVDVRELVASGAPLDGPMGQLRTTPLITAVYRSHPEIVAFLIDHRADLNKPDAEGSTPLLHACWSGKTDSALALIKAGADVNRASRWGRTPLMYAANSGEDEVIQALVAGKAALNPTCDEGPAIDWAASTNHLNAVKILGDAGAQPTLATAEGAHYNALVPAAANGNLEMIDYLLGRKAEVNGTDRDGRTPLITAIIWQKPEVIRLLLSLGADPNPRDTAGDTALTLAAAHEEVETVRALIAAKADVDATDAQGETALTRAGNIADMEIVDLLKAAGAKRTDVHIIPAAREWIKPPPERAYGLALSAIYTQLGAFSHQKMGNGRSPEQAKQFLQNRGVGSRDELLARLTALRDHGDRETYRTEGAKLAAMTDDEAARLIAAQPDAGGKIRATRASYIKWKDRTGLAWDLSRESNLVSLGFAAGYLNAYESWDWMLQISKAAQPNFSSWQEFSDNFLDGREIWAGARDPQYEACAKLLLNPSDPNSPWNATPWTTPL
jgi:ankyrin repeat protein